MLPLLALIGGGASLVDGLDSVKALDRLSLVVDPAMSDLASPSVEPHFLVLDEDDGSTLIGGKALDDYRIEHDTAVNRVFAQDSFAAPSEVADSAMIERGQQAFPGWHGAPGITYSEFANWLGDDQFAEFTSLRALAQSFPFDAGYLTPDDVARRPAFTGIINDHLTRWLDDRIAGVTQSAFNLESPVSSESACEQPFRLHADELPMEERWQGLSTSVELLRGGLIIVGLDEPYNPGSGVRAGRLTDNLGKASPTRERCNHLGCALSNKRHDLRDQWRVRRENHRDFNTYAELLSADGQSGSQLAEHFAPGEWARSR